MKVNTTSSPVALEILSGKITQTSSKTMRKLSSSAPFQVLGIFLKTLTIGRISISALALGNAIGAYEIALKYSNEREAFKKKINQFQGVSFKLAEMETQIQASRQLIYHAAWLKDNGKDVIKDAAIAKLFSSEATMKITTEAIQVLGGYGYIKEYNVERFFRDAKILTIGEGTSEVQKIVITREILKKYSNQ